jgi:DNA-binding response OmpR family regulator
MLVGETTGPVGFWNESGKQLDAVETVQRLLADMRTAAIGRNLGHYDRLSDELSIFAQAYLTTPPVDNFADCKLSPSERVLADLLYSKLGKVVSKDSLMSALYFNKVEEAQPKILDVFMFHIRKAIAGKFVIESEKTVGFRMVRAS